jgi:hypothetical protein
MKMRFRKLLVLLLVVSVSMAAASAYAEEKASVTAKTKSIAAFKNGLGYFVREGEAKLSDGWATYDGVPPAALGTFWVGSNKPGVTIERLVASEEEVIKPVPAISINEMLSANVGKDVVFQLGDKLIRGKLIATPEDRKPVADQQQPNRPYGYALPPPTPTQSSIILVDAAEGTMAINKSEIKWVSFVHDSKSNYDSKEKVKRLRFKVSGGGDKAPVTIGYLQKGITWSPAYLVELIDDAKARITMQGLLANDVEDIDGADVYFVVGYPNFITSDIVSPLALTQSVDDFITSLTTPPQRRTSYDNFSGQVAGYAFTRMADLTVNAPLASSSSFGYPAGMGMPGAPEEDLFLYQVKNVSLKKGERAYYTVFSAETPYEHAYEWIIPDTSNVQASGYVQDPRSDNRPVPQDQVWHVLRLTNTSPYPWTTAPAMSMSGGRPLADDSLDYTAKGTKTNLRVTVATDVKATKSEVEKSRERTQADPYTFSKITSDGKLTVKNLKSKPITITIKRTLTGDITTIGQGGKVVKSSEGMKAVNPTSVLTWELKLAPGEEKAVDYTYVTLVRY